MLRFLTVLLFISNLAFAQCQVTCTRLEGPGGEVEYYWYDATPGQCATGKGCVHQCDGSCSPYCEEYEAGQSKPGLCEIIPGPGRPSTPMSRSR